MEDSMEQKIRVLLVDDEVLALEFLEGLIPWEQLGYEVVGKVTNGKKALAIYQEKKPQIVISDIKMAVMDGLELSKRIREISVHTKIILLSAYKDFEYAKKGIQYGVNNYLLKHELSSERLQAELADIRESLEKDDAKHNIIREHFVKSLIFNLSDEEGERYIKSIGNSFCFLMVQKNTSVFSKYGQPENVETLKELVGRADKICSDGLRYVTDIPIRENNYLILYKWEPLSSGQKKQEMLVQLLRLFTESMTEEEKKQITLLVSREVPCMEIADHFRKLSGAVRYHIFMTQKKYYFVDELPIAGMDTDLDFKADKEALETCLREGRPEGGEVIGNIFRKLVTPGWNLSACMQAMALLDFILEDGETKGRDGIYNIGELEDYYRTSYTALMERNGYSVLIRNVLAYIHENYAEELTLEGLGKVFHMNGVYLGQIFKKEVGTTFLKYVTDCRIQAAKKMLESGRYNVVEVAETVGYRTGQYFSQIFLKNTGYTPQAYKKRISKAAEGIDGGRSSDAEEEF